MNARYGKTREKKRARDWFIIALAAITVHLLLFVGVRQSVFDIFRQSINEDAGASSPRQSFPDAIIAITIDIEGDEPTTSEIVEQTTLDPPTPQDTPEQPGRGDDPLAKLDILDITGESQAPLPSERSGLDAAVPPRPVEITWPETKHLKHCLGLQILIRIEVAASGEVLRVETDTREHPPDCTNAALDAARRIKFLPGRVKGRPARMWTQLRIDFRTRK